MGGGSFAEITLTKLANIALRRIARLAALPWNQAFPERPFPSLLPEYL
jgi:hypothetical protein